MTEVESVKVAACEGEGVRLVRITLGDKWLTMSPQDAHELARILNVVASMQEASE